MKRLKRIIFLLFLFLAFIPYSFAQKKNLSKTEEDRLISNLNYIQFSIAKIKAAENKAIAEDIYFSIINELRLGYINNTSLQLAYRNFIECCSNLKLKEDEKAFIEQLNAKAQKQAYLSAFSNLGSVFVPGQTPQQMVASLLYTTVSNAFAVANAKNQLKNQLEKDLFYLNQDIVKIIYSMQSDLFATSVNILSQTSSNGRINDDSMGHLIKIISLSSSQERLNLLKEPELSNNFRNFPPYWYELGNAFQAVGDNQQALKCYEHFIALKPNDVVEKDAYYVKLLQNKIQIYLGESSLKVLDNATRHRTEILSAIETLKQNYLDTQSGEKNLYLAKIYYMIGEIEESLHCLDYIINAKTLYPQYIEESIQLKDLILCSQNNDMGKFYQTAHNFSKILFGEANESEVGFWESIYNLFFVRYNPYVYVISKGNSYIKKYMKEKGVDNDYTDFRDRDHLYFSIPKSLKLDYNKLSVSIDNKYYNMAFVEVDSLKETNLCFVDYEWEDIEQPIWVSIENYNEDPINERTIQFKISPVDIDKYEAASKALTRIGSDISVHNAELVCDFGEVIEDYDYKVDDVADMTEDVKDDLQDEKEEKQWTEIELNDAISQELKKRLSPDLTFLRDRFTKTKEAFYKKKNHLFNPSIAWHVDSPFLIGIYSIQYHDNNVIYGSNGEFKTAISESQKTVLSSNLKDYLNNASMGDINAMVNLGIAFYEGYGTEPNYKTAFNWLLKAVNCNKVNFTDEEKISLAKACKYIGICYFEGKGVKTNKSIASIWFQKAKEYGIHVEDKFLDDGWF